MTMAKMVEIHSGDSTHHQDQFITFASLSPINNIVNMPVNPIPLLDELDLLFIIHLSFPFKITLLMQFTTSVS